MDGAKTSYAYDPANRMTVLYEGAVGSTATLDIFGYDALGSKTTQIARPGISGQLTGFGYDGLSRLSTMGHDMFGVSHDVTWRYGYNPASQIVSLACDNDSFAWGGAYNVNRAYTTNGLNQYTAAGPAAFSYDMNGNLTSDGTVTYLYDVENRLVSASGARSAALRYDPLGRLYETNGARGLTRFLYDGDELVAEFDAAGTVLRRFVHGTGVDDPVVWNYGDSLLN